MIKPTLEKNLTANLPSHKSGNLLDVNERLHELAGRLKERRPEDVAEALKLVEAYGSLVADNKSFSDMAFEKLQQLLPEAKLEKIDLILGEKSKEVVMKELNEFCHVSENVSNDIASISFMDGKHSVSLVKLRIRDLMSDNLSVLSVLNSARDLGLFVATPEISALLRLKITNQKIGDHLWIPLSFVLGMDSSYNRMHVICREDDSYLDGLRLHYRALPDGAIFTPKSEIIFVLPAE